MWLKYKVYPGIYLSAEANKWFENYPYKNLHQQLPWPNISISFNRSCIFMHLSIVETRHPLWIVSIKTAVLVIIRGNKILQPSYSRWWMRSNKDLSLSLLWLWVALLRKLVFWKFLLPISVQVQRFVTNSQSWQIQSWGRHKTCFRMSEQVIHGQPFCEICTQEMNSNALLLE